MQKNYQRAALALIAVSIAGLYGSAIHGSPTVNPFDRPARAPLKWVALPELDRAAVVPPPSAADDSAAGKRPAAAAEPLDGNTAASFDLRAVRNQGQPIPRLFAQSVPREIAAVTEAKELKRTFIKLVLPLALKVNEEILAERHHLLLLHKQMQAGHPLSAEQQEWLVDLAARYASPADDLAELIRRVDVISPALALAQSAEESGWGRSRFALKGNALFGQRTWSNGVGIVPKQRGDDRGHEVRAFPSLLDSVRSYAQNLNGHPAYEEFRSLRAEMRAADGDLDPYSLVETLTAYSERREQYIETIQTILRIDRLQELENSYLKGHPLPARQLTQLKRH